MQAMSVSKINSRIRYIAHTIELMKHPKQPSKEALTWLMSPEDTLRWAATQLRELEAGTASRDPEAFEVANITALGFDTVLGYLNKLDPLGTATLDDPVRETIQIGVRVAAICRQRGIEVHKVPACDHIKQRYGKIEQVNAYPISILDEVFAAN